MYHFQDTFKIHFIFQKDGDEDEEESDGDEHVSEVVMEEEEVAEEEEEPAAEEEQVGEEEETVQEEEEEDPEERRAMEDARLAEALGDDDGRDKDYRPSDEDNAESTDEVSCLRHVFQDVFNIYFLLPGQPEISSRREPHDPSALARDPDNGEGRSEACRPPGLHGGGAEQ